MANISSSVFTGTIDINNLADETVSLTALMRSGTRITKRTLGTMSLANVNDYYTKITTPTYTHPLHHDPSIISQDVNNRFVTDIEISSWNAKTTFPGFGITHTTAAYGDHKHLAVDVTDLGSAATASVNDFRSSTWNPDLSAYSTKVVADTLYRPINYSPDLSSYSTKLQADALYKPIDYSPDLSGYVPTSRTVNGHALTSNIAVTPTDLGLVIGLDVLAYRTFGSAANSATTDFAAASHTQAISSITGLTTALSNKLETSLKGSINGLAELGSDGIVPSSQLPSYVSDIVNVSTFTALPITGASNIIYITDDTNITYRWTGSGYAIISDTIALGETSATAYRGDRGKTAYDHSQVAHQVIINGTGFVKASGTTLSYDNSTYYTTANTANYIPLTALSSSATGLTYTNTTGVFSLTSGYYIPNSVYQPQFSGTGFVKSNGTAGNISYDNSTYVVANSTITGATYNNITYDTKGLVTGGSNVAYVTGTPWTGLYLPLTGGIVTGQTDIKVPTSSTAGLNVWTYNTDDTSNYGFNAIGYSGANRKIFRSGIYQTYNAFTIDWNESTQQFIYTFGLGDITVNGKFIKSGGSATQYLMADGSLSTGGTWSQWIDMPTGIRYNDSVGDGYGVIRVGSTSTDTTNMRTAGMIVGVNYCTGTNSSIVIADNYGSAINARGFRDQTQINTSGGISYANFDAEAKINGTSSYGHFIGFQNRQRFASTGTLTNWIGHGSIPTKEYGTITNVYDFVAYPGYIYNGSGNWVNRYCYYVDDNSQLTATYDTFLGGSSTTWGLYIKPNIPSYTAGSFTASSFIKTGGNSAQFLKADGSVDSTTYATSVSGGYLPLSAGSGSSLTGTLYGTTSSFSAGALGSIYGYTWVGNTTFLYGSSTAHRLGVFSVDSGDRNGIDLGYDVTNGNGIIASHTLSNGAGIDFWTFDGSNWASRFLLNKTGAATFSSTVTVNGTTASTSSTTGALVVGGGIGANGNIYASGKFLTSSGHIFGVNTSDGADNSYAVLAGSDALDNARSGYVLVYGNEYSSGQKGTVTIGSGAGDGSTIGHIQLEINGVEKARQIGDLFAIGYTSDPTSGNKLAVNGNGYFSGGISASDYTATNTVSNTVGNGPRIGLVNTSNSYMIIQQLNVDYGLDYWGYSGSGFSKISTLSKEGNATFSGSVTATGTVTIGNYASAPTGVKGTIYFNTTDNHFYGYNGSTWKQLDN